MNHIYLDPGTSRGQRRTTATTELDDVDDSGLAQGPAAQRAIELWAQRDDASEADLIAAIRADDDGNSRRREGAAGSDAQQPAEGDTDVEMDRNEPCNNPQD